MEPNLPKYSDLCVTYQLVLVTLFINFVVSYGKNQTRIAISLF